MLRTPIMRAWKWLLAHLAITASLTYFATVAASLSGLVKPESILMATTYGIRHLGGPILTHGIGLGIDRGVMIFFCNMTVALLIMSVIYWVRMLNPYNTGGRLSLLRRQLQKDRTAKHLRAVPYFARIKSLQLRLSVFFLLCVPFIVIVLLGLIIGSLLGAVHMISSSPLIALAYIMPHGVFEISALLLALACSIPLAIWMVIKPTVDNENSRKAFRRIERMATSQPLQQQIKLIINLLLIAGLVEAHFTRRIVQILLDV